MKKIMALKLIKPSISKHLTLIKPEELLIEDEAYFTDLHIQDGFLEEARAKALYFKSCIFENVTFIDVTFDGLELSSCIFKNCDLSRVQANRAIVQKTEFVDCKMTGSVFSEAAFNDVSIENAIGDYFTARYAEFKNTRFSGCKFIGSDFNDSKFTKVEIEHSDLSKSSFTGVHLNGMDLRTNKLDSLSLRLEDLKGSKVTTLQALELTRLLEIVIED